MRCLQQFSIEPGGRCRAMRFSWRLLMALSWQAEATLPGILKPSSFEYVEKLLATPKAMSDARQSMCHGV